MNIEMCSSLLMNGAKFYVKKKQEEANNIHVAEMCMLVWMCRVIRRIEYGIKENLLVS